MSTPMPALDDQPPTRGPTLPKLREELILLRGASGSNGAPTWLLHDPVRHRFYSIDEISYELLSLLPRVQTASELSATADKRFNRQVSSEEIGRFLRFIEFNQLCFAPAKGDWRNLHALAQKAELRSWQKLAQEFLSFRLPLFHPQRFLLATLPVANLLASRIFLIMTCLAGGVGLYLVSRQWDQFTRALPDTLDWSWAATFAVGLAVMKLLHELGHAYAAVRLGCHVSSMGIVFMTLAPMPYTDVTDAWRLTDRRKRQMIDCAGMVVELAVASYATFLWAFLPDGQPRSIAFVLATTGWMTSLAVNLNPFMRFDGYHVLCEIVKLENLQTRAFAVGRWQLREILFGLSRPPPEPLGRGALRWLSAYACIVCIWRLMLAFSIAAALYHFAFKLAGLILLMASMALLVVRPLFSELKEWMSMRTVILSRRRSMISAAILFAALLACIVPWSRTVVVPAVVEIEDQRPLHPPRPGLITAVDISVGSKVRAGQELVRMHSQELATQMLLAQSRLRLVETRLLRSAADASDRSISAVLDEERAALMASIAGIRAAQDELTIRAPIDGTVLELDAAIQTGRFVGPSEPLMLIATEGRLAAKGYVPVDDVNRISVGAAGVFIADDPRMSTWPVTVERIGAGGSQAIEIAALASIFEGPVTVVADPKGRLVPTEAQVHVVMRVKPSGMAPRTMIRGTVHLSGESRSLFERAWRRVMRVLMQESGA